MRVLLDRREELREVEAGHRDDARAAPQRVVEHERQPVDVEEREHRDHAVGLVDVPHGLELAEVRHEVAVREHDALGEPGRAARERQRDDVAGGLDRRPRRGSSRRCEQGLERRRAGGPAEREDLLDAGHARRLDCSLGQHRSGHEKAGAGHAQLQRGLGGRVQPVDGRVRPAGAGNAVKRDGVLRHVGRVDADDLARLEPACSQPGSTAIDVVRPAAHRSALRR